MLAKLVCHIFFKFLIDIFVSVNRSFSGLVVISSRIGNNVFWSIFAFLHPPQQADLSPIMNPIDMLNSVIKLLIVWTGTGLSRSCPTAKLFQLGIQDMVIMVHYWAFHGLR